MHKKIKLMKVAKIELEVSPAVRGRRTVIARRAGSEIYRDVIDVNKDKERQAFVKRLQELVTDRVIATKQLMKDLVAKADAIDDEVDEAGADAAAGGSVVDRVVALIDESQLFTSTENEYFALVEHVAVGITTMRFAAYIRRLAKEQLDERLTSNTLKEVIDRLAAIAACNEQRRTVYVRVAQVGEKVYLDLGHKDGKMVIISPAAVEIATSDEVIFRRPDSQLELPLPLLDSAPTLEPLFELMGIKDREDQCVIAGALIVFLLADIPQLVLAIVGPTGSAKTTRSRLIKLLIDPTKALLRKLPRNSRDLLISARQQWLVAYDNVSEIPDDTSDMLCQVCTGAGDSVRALYTDGGEYCLEVRRPLLLNAINDPTRADLLSRTVPTEVAAIDPAQRLTEAKVMRRFEELRPALLGSLVRAVQHALADHERIYDRFVGQLPRMADVAVYAMAGVQELGFKPEEFLRALERNQGRAERAAMEDWPVFRPLMRLLRSLGEIEMSATDLLLALDHQRGSERPREGWPRSTNALSSALRRNSIALANVGVIVEKGKGKKGRKLIIRWAEGAAPASKKSKKPAQIPTIVKVQPRKPSIPVASVNGHSGRASQK